MPTLHVCEARYNRNRQQVAILTTPMEYDGDSWDYMAVMSNQPRAFMYNDVSPEEWAEFKAADWGAETDVYWETRFKGLRGEKPIDPLLYFMLPTSLG